MKCKNCNVNVKSYLERCPLCHEKLNNNTTDDSPYNNHFESFSKNLNTKYFSKVIIDILLLTSIITILVNIIVNKKVSWSLYVVSSCLYITSFYSFITIKNKKISLLINVLALLFLLFMISFLTHTTPWFIYLVGPIIIIVTLFIYLNIYLSKYNNVLRNFSCLLIFIAFALFSINGLIKLYKTSNFYITWSIYANAPILIISLICMILSFNKKIQNEVEKRFFI